MFWANYLFLCGQKNKTPSGLGKELGFSSGTITGWKNGVIPSDSSLVTIADYFGLDKWDLLGKKISSVYDGGDQKNSILAERHTYVNGLFDQLSFEDQLRAIDYLKALLQSRQDQDGQKGSD